MDVKVVSYCIASMIIRTRLWFSERGRLSKHKISEIMVELVLSGLIRDKSKISNINKSESEPVAQRLKPLGLNMT
jgi:hypothetical protein